jgi:hypothetical protein
MKRWLVVVFLVAATMVSASVPATGLTDADLVWYDREPSVPAVFEGRTSAGFRIFDSDLPPLLVAFTVRATSDSAPDGVKVRVRRRARNDPIYTGTLPFRVEGDDGSAGLLVADGDTVRVTYRDVTAASGVPVTKTIEATWQAASRAPDSRQLVFSNADVDHPTVFGAPGAVGPSAVVEAGDASVGAGADGSFTLLPAAAGPAPSSVSVMATEPGLPASSSTAVQRAGVVGRVVVPGTLRPVESAIGWVHLPDEPDECAGVENCSHAQFLSDRNGRFHVESASSGFAGTPGQYDVDVEFQEVAEDAPWGAAAYGNPPTVQAEVVSADVTVDVGDIELVGPNFEGIVRDLTGVAVPEPQVYVTTPAGDPVFRGYGSTGEANGGFGLHLADGGYRVWATSPYGCGGVHSQTVDVSVVDGKASPPSAVFLLAGPVATPDVTVPLGDLAGELTILGPSGEVDMVLDGTLDDAGAELSLGCSAPTLPEGFAAASHAVALGTQRASVVGADVCLPYSFEAMVNQGLTTPDLKVWRSTSGGLVELAGTVDTAAGQVCTHVSSLGTFVLGAAQESAPPPAPATAGYWFVASDGGIFAYDAPFRGSMGGTPLNAPVVGMTPTVDGSGYWLVASDGGIFAFGAPFSGSRGGQPLNMPIVGMAADPDGRGYWFVASDGGIFAYDAVFRGSAGGSPVSAPIVGMAPMPDGLGYWLVGADGAVYAYGSARHYGSTAARRLGGPIVGMAAAPDGHGYWLVGADGAVFAFGSAVWLSSLPALGIGPVSPIVGMAATSDGRGYWLTAADGGVFAFGNAAFLGSMGGHPLNRPIVGMAASL